MRLLAGGGALALGLLVPVVLIGVLVGGVAVATDHATTDRPVSIDDLAAPTAFAGSDTGCTETDPTTQGCLTATTLHGLNATIAAFGAPGPGAPIRSITCWDRHAWNPSSDHPKGRACDLFPGRAGEFARGADLTNGWRLATWLRTNAGALKIKYLIWQGRFWSPDTPDRDGWGTLYTGGGIYDPTNATGGHYDHVHASYL